MTTAAVAHGAPPRERPILFSAPMVRAILEGRKTQTRRVCKAIEGRAVTRPHARPGGTLFGACPYGEPGERLWVRETWALPPAYDPQLHGDLKTKPSIGPLVFAEQYGAATAEGRRDPWIGARWRPSIFLPRWASRITLELTGARVERLNDISGEDSRAEGIDLPRCDCEVCCRSTTMCPADAGSHVEEFAHLWDQINGKRAPWASNPWVWCLSFTRVDR